MEERGSAPNLTPSTGWDLEFKAQLELTVQVLCFGDAPGLKQTLKSIHHCLGQLSEPITIDLQLLPWQLTPAGLERCLAASGQWESVRWVNTGGCRSAAQALNRAFPETHTDWIWWLESGDVLQPLAVERWRELVQGHPRCLLVAAEGEHLGPHGEVLRRHRAMPASSSLMKLAIAGFYCPGAWAWHRDLWTKLGPIDEQLQGAFGEAWLRRALKACGHRCLVVAELWVQTHALSDWNAPKRCRQKALEISRIVCDEYGHAPGEFLHLYGLQLQRGDADIGDEKDWLATFRDALKDAAGFLPNNVIHSLQVGWGLDERVRPWQQQVDGVLRESGIEELWCVSLLRNLLHPELGELKLGNPWGPSLRLAKHLLSKELWGVYRLLRQDEKLINILNQDVKGLPVVAILHWLQNTERQEQFDLEKDSRNYLAWWRLHGGEIWTHIRLNDEGKIEAEPGDSNDDRRQEQRPFGMNLIGHAFEVFGVGEDVRMAALALQSAEVPFCVVNVPANNGAGATDRSLENYTLPPGETGPYRFNLVCLTALSHGGWIAREGLTQQQGRITLVTWPWETQTWPAAWKCMIPLADRFWPSSTFTARALKPFSHPAKRPLQVMPMAVHIDQPWYYRSAEQKEQTRKRWGLEQQATLVLFVFDVKSSLARKNPWGAIEVFQRAFPKGINDNVQLVIKALRPSTTNREWETLQKKAEADPTLKVIDAELSRSELLSLMGACDVFLSLHRSEGFGRGIAEAAILGLQVVCSSWGGNTDFCKGEPFHLVPCDRIKIERGIYAHAEGHDWGEPDLADAARQLRESIRHHSTSTALNNGHLNALSIRATGERYKRALEIHTSNAMLIRIRRDNESRRSISRKSRNRRGVELTSTENPN
jgi:glycosyltransferase involved in cell wall biosynthesis